MPLYDFWCTACGAIQEILQRFDAEPPSFCTQCGEACTMVRDVPRGSSFQLKGDGWAKDGYTKTSNLINSKK